MKGDKGVCSAGTGNNMVRRTKFDNQKNAQEACDYHTQMGLAPADSTVYKCKVCKMFHFGKNEWRQLYGYKK